MSEQSAEQPQEGSEQTEQQDAKTFDADYVKKLRDEAAKYRTEAKSNSEAAKRLAEIEDAQKTETEKTAERIAKAEAEVATVPNKVAEALREHLVTLHEIDKDDAELFLTGTEPELLLKQVTRLLGQSDKRKASNNHAPREGATSTSTDGGHSEFTRELFASGG